jgi:hypothetical protein
MYSDSFGWDKTKKNVRTSLPAKPKPMFKASPAGQTQVQFPMGSSPFNSAPMYRSVLPPPQSFGKNRSTLVPMGDLSSQVFSMSKSGKNFSAPLESIVSITQKSKSNSVGAPIFNGTLNLKNSFRSNYKPNEVIDEIKSYCSKHHILDIFVCREKYEIEGRYFSAQNALAEFIIRIYNSGNQSSPQSLVQFTCLSGCRFTFLHFTQQLTVGLNECGVVAFTKIPTTPNTFSETFQLPPLDLDELSFGVDYFLELLEMIETGYHDECQTGASCLVNKSKELQTIRQLEQIPNIVKRLIAVCSESCDVFLVRNIIIILINGCRHSDIIRDEAKKLKIQTTLDNLKTRWSSTQTSFGIIEIRKSEEVVTQVDKALDILVNA